MYIKIKSRISKFYAFFHKKKAQSCLMTFFFCKRPVLIYLHARELFRFLFSSADFHQNQVFTNKPPGNIISVSSILDPDQDQCSGFKLFAKGYWQTTKFSAGMQRLITVVFNIGSFKLRYTCNVYYKYLDTLNIFHMLCPFKQSKSNIQRI